MKKYFLCLVFAGLYLVAPNALSVNFGCPPAMPGHRPGPFDYNNKENWEKWLPLVEQHHFTTEVETLQNGNEGYLESDIDYTLQTFPNHHRALRSLAELAIREQRMALNHMPFTVACYFIRASIFVPNDGMVNALYAYYLSGIGTKDLAQNEIEQAIKKSPKNARVAYYVGLAYYYIHNYQMAREYSAKAKALGSTAVGLDKLLSRSGAKDQHEPKKSDIPK